MDIYLAILGDLFFVEYSHRLAEHHAQAGGRAFLSRFDRRRTSLAGEVRAWHCADMPFAFGAIDTPELAFLIGGTPNAEDHTLSRRMMAAWTDFATTGDPGWPSTNSSANAVMTWKADDGPASEDRSKTRALWRDVDFALLHP